MIDFVERGTSFYEWSRVVLMESDWWWGSVLTLWRYVAVCGYLWGFLLSCNKFCKEVLYLFSVCSCCGRLISWFRVNVPILMSKVRSNSVADVGVVIWRGSVIYFVVFYKLVHFWFLRWVTQDELGSFLLSSGFWDVLPLIGFSLRTFHVISSDAWRM